MEMTEREIERLIDEAMRYGMQLGEMRRMDSPGWPEFQQKATQTILLNFYRDHVRVNEQKKQDPFRWSF
jgi:hypothetical protein